uniref:Uncharacterized protein n=1 Tax=Trichogramma kaykai TaxID=54128 RepID=A0ABD2W0U1_9HYME
MTLNSPMYKTTIIIHQKSLHCTASCTHNVIIHLDIPTLKEKTAAATAKRVQFLRSSTRGYKCINCSEF